MDLYLLGYLDERNGHYALLFCRLEQPPAFKRHLFVNKARTTGRMSLGTKLSARTLSGAITLPIRIE